MTAKNNTASTAATTATGQTADQATADPDRGAGKTDDMTDSGAPVAGYEGLYEVEQEGHQDLAASVCGRPGVKPASYLTRRARTANSQLPALPQLVEP